MNQKDRMKIQRLIEERTMPEPNSGCWHWMLSGDQEGYAKMKWKGMTRRVSRLSIEAYKGISPEGFVVKHSCDVPYCVNPDHLSLGSAAENTREAAMHGFMRGPGVHREGMPRDHRPITQKTKITGAEVTYAMVDRTLSYDQETGEFRWKERPDDMGWSRKLAGKMAGSISPHGKKNHPVYYRRISVAGRDHYAHRLAWLLVTGHWPEKSEIDHINGDTLDNRFANLRKATHAQNGHNTGLRRNNKSGVKGVSWDGQRNKWFASITMDGKSVALGRFDEFDDAVAARSAAEDRYHGAFAHTVGTA